jgi:hypothetical protein
LANHLHYQLRLRNEIKNFKEPANMSIEKKSLISSLKTTKKANVASTSTPEASQKISKINKTSKIQKVNKASKVHRA